MRTRNGGAWCLLLQAGTDPTPVAPRVDCRPWGKDLELYCWVCRQPAARVTHLLLPRWFSRTGDISWGCAAAGDTHHTVPQTLIAGEKGLQPHESLFGNSCPFSSAWCLVAGHGISGEGWSGSRSTATCFCEGQIRAPRFGTSPLPRSSLNLIARDAGRDQIFDC